MNKYKLKLYDEEFICITKYSNKELKHIRKRTPKIMEMHTTEDGKEIRIPKGVGKIKWIKNQKKTKTSSTKGRTK